MLAFLDAHHVAGKQLHIVTVEGADDDVSLVVSRENLHDEDRVRGDLERELGMRARLIDGFGAVSAIGAGINQSYDNLRRGTRALQTAGVTPRDIATSSFRITWFVERRRVDDAARLLHRALIDAQPLPVP
jgi:aspartate kinase